MVEQALIDLQAIGFVSFLARDHNQIQTNQRLLMTTKRFSDATLQSIAPHRFVGHSSGDCDAEPGAACLAPRHINGKQAIIATASSGNRRAVIHTTQEAFASHEAGIAHCRRITSPGTQALSCARPLARRALITARPARVFIRALKPCRRFRLTSLGWKVRFIMRIPNSVAGFQKRRRTLLVIMA